MLSGDGSDAKVKRRRTPATGQAIRALVAFGEGNPDKAFVMASIGELVADGLATCETLENREIELRFQTGETFLLAEKVVIRLA